VATEELFVQAMKSFKKKFEENHLDALGIINEASFGVSGSHFPDFLFSFTAWQMSLTWFPVLSYR
jgi:hypothetical protein